MANPGQRRGFFSSLQNMGVTLTAMLQTRVELLGNEVEVEKLRILRMLILSQALLFSASISALLIVSLLTLWLWDLRLGVLAVFAGLFIAGALFAYRSLMGLVKRAESPFAATLSELREDLQQLKAASGNATTPD